MYNRRYHTRREVDGDDSLAGAPLRTHSTLHGMYSLSRAARYPSRQTTCACARCGAKRCSTSLIPAFANKIHVCFLIIINHVMPAWMDMHGKRTGHIISDTTDTAVHGRPCICGPISSCHYEQKVWGRVCCAWHVKHCLAYVGSELAFRDVLHMYTLLIEASFGFISFRLKFSLRTKL